MNDGTGAQLMWTSNPKNLARPRLLWTAATERDLARWRRGNPWADNIECVLFQGDRHGDAPEMGIPFGEQQPPDGAPWRIVGAPIGFPNRREMETAYTLQGIDGPGFAASLSRHAFAAELAADLALERVPLPHWTILADADGGALAVAVASAQGRHVAISGLVGGIPLIGSALAVRKGLHVLNADESDQARRNAFNAIEAPKNKIPTFAVTRPGLYGVRDTAHDGYTFVRAELPGGKK